MSDEFDLLSWHDAAILEVKIDRRDPGHTDTVCMIIEWPNRTKEEIEFYEFRKLSAEMNFGIIVDTERVYSAHIVNDDPGLEEIRSAWKESGTTLPNLKCYLVKTDSTGGTFKIYAEGFVLRRCDTRLPPSSHV